MLPSIRTCLLVSILLSVLSILSNNDARRQVVLPEINVVETNVMSRVDGPAFISTSSAEYGKAFNLQEFMNPESIEQPVEKTGKDGNSSTVLYQRIISELVKTFYIA